MRNFKSIIVIILIAGLVFFGYNYATKNLHLFISRFLEENFDVNISTSGVGFGLPFYLELKDVKIEDSIDVRKIRIHPNPSSLLKKSFIASSVKIIDPVARLKKEKGKRFRVPDFLNKKEAFSKIAAPNLVFSKIHVYNGTLIYGEENPIEFVKIKGDLKRSGDCLSKGNMLKFVVVGFFKNKTSDFLSPLRIDGLMEAGGITKARLQVSDVKLDSFGNLYSKYLSRVIKEGMVDFKSDIEISDKRLVARCFVEGENILMKREKNQRLDTPIVASFILLVNFRSNLIKIKNLQGNLIKVILGR